MIDYEKVYGYTSDVVIFTMDEGVLKVLLVKRSEEPFKGAWALPGGFINKGETSKEVALRKLEEETGVNGIYISELGMYDSLGRDSRGWVISNSFYSIINKVKLESMYAGERTEEVKLFSLEELNSIELSFDHGLIIENGYSKLKRDMRETLVAKEFLSIEFILSDLYTLLMKFNAVDMEKSNFFNKVKKLDFLEEAVDSEGQVKYLKLSDGKTKRPVKLYRFKEIEIKASIY